MALVNQPAILPGAFAAEGDKNTIPANNDGLSGLASIAKGFPPITQVPLAQGGQPPQRQDFNGIFNLFSQFLLYAQNGGVYAYNNTLDYQPPCIISYNGEFYSCVTENGPSTSAGVQPVTNTAYWEKLILNNMLETILNNYATKTELNAKAPLASNAGAHNGIFRGKNLGNSLTGAQSAAIQAGTFDDLYIGDYWTINGVDYVIVAFDYYYNTGDTACTTHHAVVVPRNPLYNAQMNSTNVVTGAYVGSAMYTTNLNTAKTTIQSAFGSTHLLTIRQLFQNSVAGGGYENTVGEWYDATVWLMNEFNVYGGLVWKNAYAGTNWRGNYTIDNSQYPGFALDPTMIHTPSRNAYWLRDVATSDTFAHVYGDGHCGAGAASDSRGVRPAFCIK